MRLSARDLKYGIGVMPESSRPIRLPTGGLTFCMDATEALELASQLADAVEEAKEQKCRPTNEAFFL